MPKTDDAMLQNELREMIAKIVEIDPDKITPQADFVEDLGMDSMMALEIMAAMEKKYKIQIPEDQLGKIKNLDEVLNMARQHLGA
jgi:acyl carrier protein